MLSKWSCELWVTHHTNYADWIILQVCIRRPSHSCIQRRRERTTEQIANDWKGRPHAITCQKVFQNLSTFSLNREWVSASKWFWAGEGDLQSAPTQPAKAQRMLLWKTSLCYLQSFGSLRLAILIIHQVKFTWMLSVTQNALLVFWGCLEITISFECINSAYEESTKPASSWRKQVSAGGRLVDPQCHGLLQMFIKQSPEEAAISRDNFRETQRLEMGHPLMPPPGLWLLGYARELVSDFVF